MNQERYFYDYNDFEELLRDIANRKDEKLLSKLSKTY